jgi:hypothetical protein
MTEQVKPKVTWALRILDGSPLPYRRETLWLTLNWAYMRHKWCTQQVNQTDPKEPEIPVSHIEH